jgi:hypothetical protein
LLPLSLSIRHNTSFSPFSTSFSLHSSQEEYKASIDEAKGEEVIVASLLRTHAECQQASVAVSHAKAIGSPVPPQYTTHHSAAEGGNLTAVEDAPASDDDDDDGASPVSHPRATLFLSRGFLLV